MSDDEAMDAADAAWLATMVPEGMVALGFLSMVAFLDPERGDVKVRYYNQLDAPLSQCLGLLEMAKMDLIARTPGMWFEYPAED